jgi:hypothetical protein
MFSWQMKWYHKVIDLSFWNTLAAGLNFLSNVLIVKAGGLALFGSYSYILSCVGMLSLVHVLLPASYAVMRLQDDTRFIEIYSSFYSWSLFLILLLCVPLAWLVQIPWHVTAIFSLSVLLPYYADTVFQSQNRLSYYFKLLFALATGKFASILIWTSALLPPSCASLLLFQGSVSLAITLAFLTPFFKYFSISLQKGKQVMAFMTTERHHFSGYYFAAALKIGNSNLVTLLGNQWVSKETLGIYALLMKVNTFVVGLSRTLEAMLVHREGIKTYAQDIFKHTWALGLFMQAIYMVVGAVYMIVTTGETYLGYHLFLSSILYPYLYYLQVRAGLLATYSNASLNWSNLIFTLCIGLFLLLTYLFQWQITLAELTGLVGLASLLQYCALILLHLKQSPVISKNRLLHD